MVGGPGSGKTTFAWHLSLCLLGAHLNPPPKKLTLDDLGQWPHGALTPVYIKLRDLINEGFKNNVDVPINTTHLEEYLHQRIETPYTTKLANELIKDLYHGDAVLILDGLDEVPIPTDPPNALDLRRDQLKSFADSISDKYRCRIVFTSRPYAYREEEWHLDGYQTVTMQALSDVHKFEILTKIFQQSKLGLKDAKEKARQFLRELTAREIPESMTSNPLLLTLMGGVYLRQTDNKLPTLKGELYHRSVILLLDKWSVPRIGEKESLLEKIGCSTQEIYDVLEKLAYQAYDTYAQDKIAAPFVERRDLLDGLSSLRRKANIRDVAEYLSDHSGVLVSQSNKIYEFAHRSFVECLAAAYMAKGEKNSFKIVKRAIEANPQIWREPCLLVGDILVSEQPFSEGVKLPSRKNDLWSLLEDLLDPDLTPGASGNDSRWWSIWLSACLIRDHALIKDLPDQRLSSQEIFEKIRIRMKWALNVDQALPPKERVDIGLTLGIMGDDRKGVDLINGIPNILWCKIPSGKFQMGTTFQQRQLIESENWGKGQPFDRELCEEPIYVDEFYISRYPVTVCQFQSFVDDPNGYNNPKWWTGPGKEWLRHHIDGAYKLESKWAIPNLVRVYVNWYEAVSFCNWLSDLMGYLVRLPSEAEWEKSARGTKGFIFPWGNSFDLKRSNTNLLNLGTPNPPGCFMLSEGVWGDNSPLDMSGNTWEWCSSLFMNGDKVYYYPYDKDDGREDLEVGDGCRRITRGGSFVNGVFISRTAYRGQDVPTARYNRQGFRIAASKIK